MDEIEPADVATPEPKTDAAPILTKFTKRERRIAEYEIMALRERVRYGYWETVKIIKERENK